MNITLSKKTQKVTKEKTTSFLKVEPETYGLLRPRPNNRPTSASGIRVMKESIKRNGILRYPIVVWNGKKSCYDIIDGQHLIAAARELELSFNCIVAENLSENEIVQLMIDLNNINRKWKLEDYINNWILSGDKQYRPLRNSIVETYKDIQATVIIQAYTQKPRAIATKMVKEGTFTIVNKERGDFLLDCVSECNEYLPSSRQVNEALIKLMLKVENYDHKRMMKNLRSKYKSLDMIHTKESSVYNALSEMYHS